ncbi:MAG TPA: glycosyltransferase family 2 protein [Gaiellaceae bacterium]|nr:glycosyltransferase family 2 protein [Gaiellaceae bacterium]
MSAVELSVVLVAWDSGDSLGRSVQAIRASAERTNALVEFVIVDNASTDGAVDALAPASTDVVVRNPINAGYGAAAAQGASVASGTWLLFVNPDVVVEAPFVGALVDAARAAGPEVSTLVPDMRYTSNPQLVNSRGVTVDETGIPSEVDAGIEAANAGAGPDVFGGSTGCCLIRAAALRAVGGFELCYFAYLEDVDLAQRLQAAGYTSRFVPDAVVLHEGSASLAGRSYLKSHIVARSRRLFFQLNAPRTVRAATWRALVETGHATVSILAGGGFGPLTGRSDALRQHSYTRFARNSRRKAGDDVSVPPYAARTGLLETLRRKRTVSRELADR